MQCTSFIPVYHHERDLHVGSSGFSWHLLNSNANYGEKNGYSISLPRYNMEQNLSYDKEMLRQIMQDHDATFRHQVQELHRLYKKQRELMDGMRVRKVFSQCLLSQTSCSIHSLSHARCEISQATSHATSWLLGNQSQSTLSEQTPKNIQQHSKFIPSNYSQEHPLHAGPFIRKDIYNEVKFPSSISNGTENRILDLELPAEVRNQFRERNLSEAPKLTCTAAEKDPNIRPATVSSVKTRGLSSFNLDNGEIHCFIDLNEPIQTESLPSSAKCRMETYTCRTDIMHNKSVVPNDSGLLDCVDSSNPVAIDLNSMPDNYFPETEINIEHVMTIKKEATEDHLFVDSNLVKTETDFDLNTDVVPNDPSLPPSDSTVQIQSGGYRDLEGPLSPENEECSPPRSKSGEIIQPEIPSLLSEQGKGESYVEIDTIAARTLVVISSCGAHNSLSWFADIVSANGDDLENKIVNGAHDDQGEVLPASDLGAIALDFSCVVKKEKETGNSSVRSQKGDARGIRLHKDSLGKVLPSHSKNAQEIKGFIETGSSSRRPIKKACEQPRNCSQVSSDRIKKSMGSILKLRSKHEVFGSWGKIKKREGGLRRKAGNFLVLNWVGS